MNVNSKIKNNAAKGTNEIIRVKRLPSSFVQMHKGFLEDPRLSFKAKGILGYLLTKPDNWVVRISDLMNHTKDGRDSIYAGLKELHEHKYYHKAQARDAKGRLSHWECFICEVPMTTDTDFSANPPFTEKPNTVKPEEENPLTDYPYTGKPETENPNPAEPNTAKPNTENPPLSNNYINNNDFNKNKHSNNDCSNNNPTPTSAPPAKDSRRKDHGEAAVVGETKSVGSTTDTAKVQYAEFVSMTNDEYSSLVAKIGEAGAVWCIEKLDNYKGSTGKKYDNDYRTILSWVVGRYQEHLQAKVQADSGIGIVYPSSNTSHLVPDGYAQPLGYAHPVGKTNNIAGTGDAFEDYVYKKIEEAKRHGTK